MHRSNLVVFPMKAQEAGMPLGSPQALMACMIPGVSGASLPAWCRLDLKTDNELS